MRALVRYVSTKPTQQARDETPRRRRDACLVCTGITTAVMECSPDVPASVLFRGRYALSQRRGILDRIRILDDLIENTDDAALAVCCAGSGRAVVGPVGRIALLSDVAAADVCDSGG